jgi:mRNA interferase YafQ
MTKATGTSASKPRNIGFTNTFKKDLKKAKSHVKCDLQALKSVMQMIADRGPLPAKYLDHPLTGRYPDQKGGNTDCRECHVCNDWLLVYRLPDSDTVHFIRTGTHSEIFG